MNAEMRLQKERLTILQKTLDDIVRNVRLVTMSLNISIDQLFLRSLAYILHIRNYFVGFGLAGEVMLVSDTFNTGSVVPEPSLKARDDFYKNGSYFLMNELMNCGTVSRGHHYCLPELGDVPQHRSGRMERHQDRRGRGLELALHHGVPPVHGAPPQGRRDRHLALAERHPSRVERDLRASSARCGPA